MNLFHTNHNKKKTKGVRRISDISAPVATVTVAQVASPFGGSAMTELSAESIQPKGEPKVEATTVEGGEGKVDSGETKPTVTIPSALAESASSEQPETPTVTSPTPPQTPASPPAAATALPSAVKSDLKAVHEAPGTPPAGSTAQKSLPSKEPPTKKDAPKKEAPKKKK